jgi:hypothetical protein
MGPHRLSGNARACVIDVILAELAQFEVYAAAADEIDAVQSFAAGLIGPQIVQPQALRRVQQHTGGALFITRQGDRLTGAMAFVLLSKEGAEAVRGDGFDAVDPALSHLAGRRETAHAVYGWGIATTDKESTKRLLQGYDRVRTGVAAHLAWFARAVTPAGERLMMERLKYEPYPGSTTGLIWRQPAGEGELAA